MREDERIFAGLCAGAVGYLLKKTPPARLLEAVREVAESGARCPPRWPAAWWSCSERYARPPTRADHDLTPHETRVLKLLLEGYSYKTAAVELGVSPHAVSFHLRRVYQKLEVHSKSEAVSKSLCHQPDPLAFLRSAPEDLQPMSERLLRVHVVTRPAAGCISAVDFLERREHMHEENAQEKPMDTPATGRRRFGASLLTALGASLLARRADAFPPQAPGHFNSATQILGQYGISVGGAFDANAGHDVLTVTSLPPAGTQHDLVIAELNSNGGLDASTRTSSFDGTNTFVHYAPGGIIPCIRVTIAGSAMTYDLFDPTEGDIIPCIRVETQHMPDGSLGPIVATIDPDEQNLSVVVGTRTYLLINGQLIEQGLPGPQ